MGILDMVKVQIITFYLQTSFLRPQHLIIFACVFPYLHAMDAMLRHFEWKQQMAKQCFLLWVVLLDIVHNKIEDQRIKL